MRTRITLTVLIAALLVLALGATAFAKDKRYRDDVFKKVSVTRDITYGQAPADQYGEGEQLKLDLYQPKGDTLNRGRAVLIFAHGGGFTGGDKSEGVSATLAREYAKKGYVTASINYRLNGPSTGCTGANGVTPECYAAAIDAVHDGQAAVRWFRVNSRDYGIDKKRIGNRRRVGRRDPRLRRRRARGRPGLERQRRPVLGGPVRGLDLGRPARRTLRRLKQRPDDPVCEHRRPGGPVFVVGRDPRCANELRRHGKADDLRQQRPRAVR